MDTFRKREGVLGGIVAGIVMAMVAMMDTLLTQGDLLAPLKQMGAVFFPNDSGSALSLVAGMMLHMMTAAILGVVFVLVARRLFSAARPADFWAFAIAGMIFIVAEWLVAAFAVLPAIDRPLLPTFASLGGVIAHLMYGLVLAAWLAWRTAPSAVHVHAGSHQHGAA